MFSVGLLQWMRIGVNRLPWIDLLFYTSSRASSHKVSRSKPISKAVAPTANSNKIKLLSFPARSANPNEVEAAGG